jgi:cyclic pyranopterin phosphate synthase
MPLDADGNWQRDRVLFAADIPETLARRSRRSTVPDQDPRSPASEFRFSDGIGRIGMIASVSRPFCRSCNRVRLTADGKLRNCLFAIDEMDVKGLLRGGASEDDLIDCLRRNVRLKWEGHEIHAARFVQPPRPMHAIGG